MFAFTKEEIIKEKNLKQKKRLRRKLLFNGAIALGSLALIIALAVSYFSPNAYAVLLDGEQIGIVESEEILNEALKALTPGVSQAYHLEKIELEEIKAKPDQLLNKDQIKNLLSDKLTWMVEGAVIVLNGKELVTLESVQAAEQVLEEVEKNFYPLDLDNAQNIEVTINEDIKIERKQVALSRISSLREAKNLLLGTQEKVETYVVQEGDNLWSIARVHDMRVADIKLANPELTSENLSIGQVLKLSKAEPLIKVTTSYQLEVIEKIPFETKTVKDSSILRGQTKIKQPGKEGEKQVKYEIVLENGRQVSKEVVEEKVIKEPVPKVVLQGTKLVMASRGGSGQLAWPLRGRITSSYGYRGGEFHTGLDIDGNSGDIIRAAESGKVIQAGWSGNYGYMVTIDHGDGLVTRYAHCSAILVKVGEQVERGEAIARVGSTGRSTGSHLHFEVLVNGNFKNPRTFL